MMYVTNPDTNKTIEPRDRLDSHEVEITSEMINAGASDASALSEVVSVEAGFPLEDMNGFRCATVGCNRH